MNTNIFKIPRSGIMRYLMMCTKALIWFCKAIASTLSSCKNAHRRAMLPLQTPEEGAQTSLYCCVAPECAHFSGLYFSDCAIKQASLHALNDDYTRRAYKLSRQIVKLD